MRKTTPYWLLQTQLSRW